MLMAKVLKADQARAKMYYAIYKALQNLSKRRRAPTPQEWYKEPKPEEYIKGEDSKKEKNPSGPISQGIRSRWTLVSVRSHAKTQQYGFHTIFQKENLGTQGTDPPYNL
jgi:hypothetical protein